MTFIWLRQYPRLHVLATMFNVSSAIISKDVHFILPIIRRYFRAEIRWPTVDEWRELQGSWPLLPNSLGAIDGTLTRINRPQAEPQVDFYSGRVKFHCFSTQVIIDCTGSIRYLQSGFLGRDNDARQYQNMPNIGPGQELDFPPGFCLLADKIYPNTMPLVTPYKQHQMNGPEDRALFNQVHRSFRMNIEHAISYFKTFAAVKVVYRHPGWLMHVVACMCMFSTQTHLPCQSIAMILVPLRAYSHLNQPCTEHQHPT